MKSNSKWLYGVSVFGGVLQYLWLSLIPAVSNHAEIVSFATAIIGIPIVKKIQRNDTHPTTFVKIGRLFFCMFCSSLISLGVFSIAEYSARADGIANSVVHNPLLYLLLNTVGLAGWVVGGIQSLTIRQDQ
ncbi:MAG: hypothetical protein PHI11_11705 [Gallionella sp.]|nr:hypothetical protein [Gallionella sp.]